MKTDEIKMDVNIAGERISLSVPFSRQEAVRKTEGEMNALYRAFGEAFPKKTPKELLAMVAYKFAASYFDMQEALDADLQEALALLDEADRLCVLGATDGADARDEYPLY